MKSDDIRPAARALAAVRYGGTVDLDSLSIDEEVGFLILANVARRLIKGPF